MKHKQTYTCRKDVIHKQKDFSPKPHAFDFTKFVFVTYNPTQRPN